MSHRRPPWLVTRLAALLPREREALLGDLFEEYTAGRSRLWMWHQMVWAVLVSRRAGAMQPGVDSAQSLPTDVAVWAVLAFEVVVAGTLLDSLFGTLAYWWDTAATAPLVAVASGLLLASGATGLLLPRGRVGRLLTAICCASSATAVAWIVLLAYTEQPHGFLPSPSLQFGTALLAVAVLVGWLRSRPAPR
jgi:hypothetical protein